MTVFDAGRRLTSAEGASYLGGVWGRASPGNFKNRTLRNAVSSISGTQESVSQQGLSSREILLKSKIFNKNGQLVGEVGLGTGNDKIFSRLSLQINFFVDF